MSQINVLELQKCQLSKDNNTNALLDIPGLTDFLAELSPNEGDLIGNMYLEAHFLMGASG